MTSNVNTQSSLLSTRFFASDNFLLYFHKLLVMDSKWDICHDRPAAQFVSKQCLYV